MVEVNEASARLVWAVLNDDSAEVTEASSESICVVEPPAASSAESRACAAARFAWAASTSEVRAVVPTVARTCPAVTAWPACTSTPVTVPDTPKLRSAWVAGSSVPEVATVCLIVPVVTLTVSDVMTRPVAGDPPVKARVSPVARPAIRTTAAPIRRNLRLRRRPSGAAGSPSRSRGSSWVSASLGSGLLVDPSSSPGLAMTSVHPSDVSASPKSAVSALGVLSAVCRKRPAHGRWWIVPPPARSTSARRTIHRKPTADILPTPKFDVHPVSDPQMLTQGHRDQNVTAPHTQRPR